MSSFNSLQSARVGDLCCALYSEDQRWYRGRVVELLVDRKVSVQQASIAGQLVRLRERLPWLKCITGQIVDSLAKLYHWTAGGAK